MEAEIVVLEFQITSDGFTMLRYEDRYGMTHFNSLSLEGVIQVFENSGRGEDISGIKAGAGPRLEKLDVALDENLKEQLGFNEVGEIVRP